MAAAAARAGWFTAFDEKTRDALVQFISCRDTPKESVHEAVESIHLGTDETAYEQTLVFDLLKRMLGTGPVYAALGNHDSYHKYVPSTYTLFYLWM